MNTVFLYIHIAAGFSALFFGLVAMIATKGKQWHAKTGLIYFWSMMVVSLTSTIISLSSDPMNLFLLVVGIFSFYLTFTGYRSTKVKDNPPELLDKCVTALMLLTTLAMIFLAIYDSIYGSGRLTIILGIFGTIGGTLAVADVFVYKNGLNHRREWMLRHLGRMNGAYLATFTAFAVTNLQTLIPLIFLWTLPPVIGANGIILATRYYRKKYNIPTKKQQKELAEDKNS